MARMRLTNAGKVGRPKSLFTEPEDEDEITRTTDDMRASSLQEVSSDRLYNDTENRPPAMLKGTESGRRNALVKRSRTFGAADARPKVERQQKPENDDMSDCFRCSRTRASSDLKEGRRRSNSDEKATPSQSNDKTQSTTSDKTTEKRNSISQLTDVELKKFCRYFWRSDINGSGKLTLYDFNKLTQHLGLRLNKESLHQAFKIADIDKDNEISFNDFAVTYLKRDTASIISPQQVKHFFNKNTPYNSAECIFLSKAECVQIINMLGNDFDVYRFERALKSMMDNKEKIALVQLYSFFGYEM